MLKARAPLFYARCSRMLEGMRRRSFRDRVVTHRYGSGPLTIWLANAMAQAWYDSDWAELPEIAILRRGRLRNGARVFDLGAHHGVVALMLAREVGSEGQVVAVEADPFAFRVLERNKELNHASQLKVVHAAIQERSGRLAPVAPSPEGPSDRLLNWGDQKVSGLSLDDMTREFGMPDVIFVDVDGFDCHVLRGGSETMASKPDCFIEIHVGCGLENEGGSVAEALSYFPAQEWNLQIASDDAREFVPFAPGHPLLAQRFFLIASAK